MEPNEIIKMFYTFRDLWCQNIDLSTIDEFIKEYTETHLSDQKHNK